MKQLGVYLNDIKAGILTEQHPGNGYTFQVTERISRFNRPSEKCNYTEG